MTLGFMQPYFLPYPGYFALIAQSDQWVVFDDAQMIRHGWVDRNRVLHPTEGWQYLKVQVQKHARETPIREVRVSADADWGPRLVRQLQHYRKAPFFRPVISLLGELLQGSGEDLSALNVRVLAGVCAYLGLPFAPLLHSQIEYDRGAVQGPGDWALVVSRVLGATAYVNPPGGRDLFDASAFAAQGTALRFLRWPDSPYPQLRPGYEPALSIVDLLFALPPDEIRARLLAAPLEEAAPAVSPSPATSP